MHSVAAARPSLVKAKLAGVQDSLSISVERPDRRSRVCAARQYRNLVPYQQAWDLQKQLVAERCQDASAQDTVLLLQHKPVYTLGAGSTTNFLKFDEANPPHPLFRTERGGEVTYHGPGQLVIYPVLNLRRHQADMHWYLRSLEEVVIRALDNVSGLEGSRLAGSTGVWVDGLKVAAVGVRAKRWITYHGVALNVTTELQPFQHIVPCGIADKGVSSVKMLGGHNIADQELLEEYQYALLEAFGEVFDVQLSIQYL